MAITPYEKQLVLFRLEQLLEGLKTDKYDTLDNLDQRSYLAGNATVVNIGISPKLLKIQLHVTYEEWRT